MAYSKPISIYTHQVHVHTLMVLAVAVVTTLGLRFGALSIVETSHKVLSTVLERLRQSVWIWAPACEQEMVRASQTE